MDLVRSETRIRLLRAGTYWLAGLANEESGRKQSGLNDIVAQKITTALHGSKLRPQGAAAGVRAEKIESSPLEWSESSIADLIASGKKLSVQGRYSDAIRIFKEAGEEASDPEEKAEAAFYEAATYSMQGDGEEALAALDGKIATISCGFYTEFYLLQGKLLLDSHAYDRCIAALSD